MTMKKTLLMAALVALATMSCGNNSENNANGADSAVVEAGEAVAEAEVDKAAYPWDFPREVALDAKEGQIVLAAWDYERRLKEAKELVIATFSMDYKKVLSILLDYMKRGLKEFAKDAMALLQTIVFAAEKTTKGRKAYLDDAFKNAKLLALLDPDIKDIKEQKELREDAMRIVDGTWQSYRDERVRQQKRNELLNAAVDAVVEMANAPRQKLLNANQAATIDKFLRFDGGDRNKLFDEIWQSAKSQIRNEGWQRIAISALDSYKQHGHTQGQGKGRGVV